MDVTGQRHYAYLPDKTCLKSTDYGTHTLPMGVGKQRELDKGTVTDISQFFTWN